MKIIQEIQERRKYWNRKIALVLVGIVILAIGYGVILIRCIF